MLLFISGRNEKIGNIFDIQCVYIQHYLYVIISQSPSNQKMKNYILKLTVFSLIISLAISCNVDADSSSIADQKSNPTSPANAAIQQTSAVGSVFSKHFNSAETQALMKVKAEFDKGICEGRETDKVMDCYDFHCWLLRSDLLQKSPITKNFPFKGNFAMDSTIVDQELKSIWTNKCGFQTDAGTVNYFCLDASQPVMAYLHELGKSNDVIKQYADTYAEKKTITPQDIQAFVMSAPDALDFSNFDHQIFHLLVNLSLNAEMNAMRKLN